MVLMVGGGARPRQDRGGVKVQQVQGCPLVSFYSYDCYKIKKCSGVRAFHAHVDDGRPDAIVS